MENHPILLDRIPYDHGPTDQSGHLGDAGSEEEEFHEISSRLPSDPGDRPGLRLVDSCSQHGPKPSDFERVGIGDGHRRVVE